MSMLKKGYRECSKKGMPKHWFSGAPHTHKAVDDATEQGKLFMNMLRENVGTDPVPTGDALFECRDDDKDYCAKCVPAAKRENA